MKLQHILLSTALIFQGFQALALTVDNPGSLETLLGADAAGMTTLVVDGTVNAADLRFIATSMPALKSVDLSRATIAAYEGKRLDSGISFSRANHLPEYALFGATATSVILPASITSVGEGALASSAITSAEIPSRVTSMGGSVFNGCEGLVSVTMPASITTVSAKTFYNCKSLADVAMSPALTAIADRAFAGCTSLSSVGVPSTVRVIGAEAFSHSGLREIDLSGCRALDSIGERAFADNLSLETVRLPYRVKSIGNATFFNDVALSSINIPASVTTIPAYSFKSTALSSVELDDDVTTIDKYAFFGMEQVFEWRVPSSLNYIGDNAFEGWKMLNAINATAPAEVPELGSDVWAGIDCSRVNLTVPEELVDSYSSAPQWQDFSILHSGINTGINESDAANNGIIAKISGSTLMVRANSDIESVALYDMKGVLIVSLSGLSDTAVDIDVEGVPAGIMLVNVTTVDHPSTSIKVVKR